MANPIKTSDLLNDDNLDALIAKLKALEKQLEGVDGAAEDLTKTTTALNAAEKANNESIEKAAKDAAKLDKAYEALASASSATAQELNEVRAETAELNRLQKLNAKIAKEQKGSYNSLSAQYSVAVLQLNKMSKAQRETTKTGQDLTKKAKALREEMKGLKEEVGNNTLSVGDYGSALEQLGGPIGSVIRDLKLFNKGLKAQVASLRASVGGLSGSSKALKIFRLALISTGIGAFVVVLGSLVAFLTKTQRGVDLVSRVMAGLTTAFEVIIDRIAIFGEGLFLIISGNVSAGVDKLSESFENLGEAISTAASEGMLLREEMQAIRDAQIRMTVITAKANAEIAKQRLIAEDTTKSFKARAAALNEAARVEEETINKRINIQSALLQNLKDNAEFTDTDTEAKRELAEAEAALIELNTERDKLLRSLTTRLVALNKERDAAIKLREKEIAQEKQLAADKARFKELTNITEAQTVATKELTAATDGYTLSTEESSKAVQQIIDDGKNVESAFDKINNSLVNFSEKNAQAITATISSFNIVRDTLLELSRLETEAADKRLADSDRVVDGLQKNLETELELRNQGLANRAQSVNAELQLAKTAQNEALKQKEEADEKARKLNAAAAASNLVVAAAKIFGSFPIYLAIPLVALMIGSFVATTVKANQLAKENFAEGDLSIVGGGSHASGRDTMVGMEGNKAQFAEKGEARMILDKQRTREYKSLLPVVFQALKSGTFNEQFKHVSEAGKNIPFFAPNINVNTDTMERYLKAIKDQGNKSVTFDGKGRRIERAKGITRIYN